MNPQGATSMSAPQSAVPTFKFFHGEDIRRWTPTGGMMTFPALASKAADLYGLPDPSEGKGMLLLLKYEDPEGDLVTLACESDLHELLRLELPLARVFLHLPKDETTHRGKNAPAAAPLEASSDSETDEDGRWTSKRVDKYLVRLGQHLAEVEDGTAQTKPFRLVKILARGFDNADEEGRKRIVAALKDASAAATKGSSSNAVGAFLTKLAYSPSELNLKRPVPVSARNLAGLAVSGQLPPPLSPPINNNNSSKQTKDGGSGSDSENDDGKWRPGRLDKYLSRLSQCLSQVTAESPCSFQLVRLLMRGAVKPDAAGKQKVIAALREAAEGNAPLRSLLSQVAYSPHELGLRRQVPCFARALAARGLDRAPPQLPQLPGGPSSSSPGPNGPWMRGGRGFGPCHRGRGGRCWRMLNKQEKPHVRLVSDVTVPDETRVAPGQSFTKVWRVANSGELPWDPEGKGLALLHVGGDSLGAKASTPQCVGTQPPAQGETVDLSVEMTAPMAPGRYESFFRLARASAASSSEGDEQMRFGQRIWARVVVAEDVPTSAVHTDYLISGAQPLYPAIAQPPSAPALEDADGWVAVK